VQIVSFAAWHAIEAAETARGAHKGKVRDKFESVAEMLAAAG
jgi:hypothetical protein